MVMKPSIMNLESKFFFELADRNSIQKAIIYQVVNIVYMVMTRSRINFELADRNPMQKPIVLWT